MSNILEIYKTSSSEEAIISQVLTYSIKVENVWDNVVKDVIVRDLLPSELKFQVGSIKVNEVEFREDNIISGINIGEINPNESKLITFEVKVISKLNKTIENKSMVEFNYEVDGINKYGYVYSEINRIDLKNPDLRVTKESDKTYVLLEDVINYTIRVTNIGELELYNIFLIDLIPKSLEVIDDSFILDEMIINSVEVEKGFLIENLGVNESKVINYKAKVVSGAYGNKITSRVNYSYLYTLSDGKSLRKEGDEVKHSIDMAISNFKEVIVSDYLMVPLQSPSVEEINSITEYTKISKSRVIKTSNIKSLEGQVLSGYALVLHGYVEQVIEYSSKESINTIHSINYNAPFSTIIILPRDFNVGDRIETDIIVSESHVNIVDERCVMSNITLFIVTRITYTE